MIYIDNAATSFPKPEAVYMEMDKCLRTYCANPGRGSHTMSVASASTVTTTRERIAKLLKIEDSLSISFTKNATEALNIAICGSLSPGDHVITTCMEHNSVIRPLKTLEKYGKTKLTIVNGDSLGRVDPQSIRKSINKRTKLIVCTLSSNVNGIIMPVEEIGKIARDNGIIYLIDASQGIGSINMDISQIHADMLAFPGHKGLLGPQGTGGLYVSPKIKLRPLMRGGTGSRSELLLQPDIMPDKLESGTLNTPGIAGLGAGLGFIQKNGIESIRKKKDELTIRLFEGIRRINNIKMFSSGNAYENSGIVAFNLDGMDSTEVSYQLDKQYKIECRPGLHCAPLAHAHFKTLNSGIIRLSVGCFNTNEEIDFVIQSINMIAKGH
ncbi:aminotransferase class V-fold PLP-dependent enzyme [Ruminiclostridium cellulolyticum]|uniref:cysteine desulfurase n=1 Tax=Ruminiclostridium cellulolyticum (strain ATCC 35319 / DSM 5812 / JCM 6584 / H10) TaxID=394503 RepID=B8I381_RUMCH|nr:aminotransferase class V-fold PLP-dependent enzyme [Ruminiclostridium cellulolyticum]ACL76224.1 cysteine desulfurase family protein [Ruminiclostridium cellulolyticum H10]